MSVIEGRPEVICSPCALEALEGAAACLARCRPVLIVESMKSDKGKLYEALEKQGYRVFEAGINLLAIHTEDKTLGHFKRVNKR